jgi:soluble lytic murein transglycosylase-like protein
MRAAVAILAAAVTLLAPTRARAELYTYTDEQGVIHFTNLPPEKPHAVGKTRNTYVTDDLGADRKLHRVDVNDFDGIINEAARYYSLPPALVKAVIAVESFFDAGAVSPRGARGLMQLIPETAAEMFVRDAFDARDNIYGGARYLRVLANRFSGDLRLTIAAYNAGPTVVEKARDVPAIDETRSYVQRVMALYKHYLTALR